MQLHFFVYTPQRAEGLARKAEARNPDEFYFGMHKARTEKGVAVVE